MSFKGNGSNYPSVINAGRHLRVRHPLVPSSEGALCFTVKVDSEIPRQVTISKVDAVRLARDILAEFDPDALAETKFVDLPVGTFLRRYADGKIVQVIPTPKNGEDRDLEDDCNWVEFADGTQFVAVQVPHKPAWAILTEDQVKVTSIRKWEFKP